MKITHIDIYRFSIPMEPFVIATGTMHFAQNTFIRIHTDTKHFGVGECSAFPMIVGETQETCLAMAKDFARLWKGKNPLDITSRMQELDAYANNATIKSAFDMALYDLSAKNENKPLYEFLGGCNPELGSGRKIETDITIGIGTPEAMAALATKYQIQGATIMKIKLGKNPKDDIERIRAIRDSVSSNIILRIDANQGWTFDEAIQALQGMKNFNIEFCEQPMRTWYDDFLPELCKISPIKIMADESCYNHHDARKLINSKSCDYINIKLAKSGGISEALRIYETATKAGVTCMIGGMLESRIALSAKLHFVYACPEIKFFDLDTCLIGHLEDPIIGGITFDGYFPKISNAPGIGADVNEDFLKNCEKWTV